MKCGTDIPTLDSSDIKSKNLDFLLHEKTLNILEYFDSFWNITRIIARKRSFIRSNENVFAENFVPTNWKINPTKFMTGDK